MKRLMLGVLLLAAVGSLGTARAECASAGEYDTVSVTVGNVTIYGNQFGNFATGPATACSDASVTVAPAAAGELSIKVDGVEVCHRTDAKVSADPFGFGSGIHASPGSCGANVSFGPLNWGAATENTLTGGYAPDPAPAGADGSGAFAGVLYPSDVLGTYWLGSTETEIPSDSFGWYTRGAKVVAG